MPAHARAPPLAEVLRTPAAAPTADDRSRNERWAALWTGGALGLAWAVTLWTLLMDMDRVPWLEATLWSLASGLVLGRGIQAAARRLLRHWLGVCHIELGPQDLTRFRQRLPRALRFTGYVQHHGNLAAETYRHPATGLVAPLTIRWAGAGARIQGPRWVVRRVVLEGLVG